MSQEFTAVTVLTDWLVDTIPVLAKFFIPNNYISITFLEKNLIKS